MLPKTGLTIEEHLRRTVDSVVELRSLGIKTRVIPILQGWLRPHYLRCAEMYADAGIDLLAEPLVRVGSMCRRQNHWRASSWTTSPASAPKGRRWCRCTPSKFKIQGLTLSRSLASADSMAWSSAGRRERGCSPTHKTESNCMSYALWWRNHLMERLDDAGVPACTA